MPRLWVFFATQQDWQELHWYCDAKDFNKYSVKQWMVTRMNIKMVKDDTYEILSSLTPEELAATLVHYVDELSTLNMN